MKSVLFNTRILGLILALVISGSLLAKENVSNPGTTDPSSSGSGDGFKITSVNQVLSGCVPGKAQTEIKLNNVRTRILADGDMWWDLNNNPKYEVPKGSGSYACFAGSLWFGGYVNGGLRISSMTYRQSGVDFWPGPLDPITGEVDAPTCNEYDKHWRFNRADVDEFYAKYASNVINGTSVDASYSVPTWIKEYPGSSPSGLDHNYSYWYLAPYFDADANYSYDWTSGDYPGYNVTGTAISQGQCKGLLFGDETLFWVFNDKGNNHTESGSVAQIGVEIRAQAFEFATSDVLNDMTFYTFEIINRSTNILDSTYFAVWVDADLGYYKDDYVGCDVTRGLGYIYNGDNNDESANGVIGYGKKLPALGCDFFQGPNADVGDNLDNDRDGCIDCTWQLNDLGKPDLTLPPIPDNVLPEHISMSKFVAYNNDFNTRTGNPSSTGGGIQYYNLMTGSWLDNNGSTDPVTYGDFGTTATDATHPPCSYMYPGSSDPFGYGVGGGPNNHISMPAWSEYLVPTDQPGDRRFLQSAGKFTLTPGAINVITFGMPFVRTNSDNNFAAIPLLLIADDKAQSLFDNCFKVLDGPDAPDMTIQEMENQLIFYFSNQPSSNNYEQHRYADVDPTIPPLTSSATDSTDRTYRFEGYMVFQLKDETVSATDLYDDSKARLVFQCDKKNGVAALVNYTPDPSLGLVPQLMTPEYNDAGVKNSFVLTDDKFAEGDPKLVNHKTYYYMAVSYAYNNYLTYKQDVAPAIDSLGNTIHLPSGDFDGQKKPYLQGRRNIKVYSAIPHNISPEANGTVLNCNYGYVPSIKRIEGQGNGGNILELTQSTVDQILSSSTNSAEVLEYEPGYGPIQVKVIDPLKVVEGSFEVMIKKVIPTYNNSADSLVMGSTDDLDYGKVKMDYKFEITGTYTNSDGVTESNTWYSDDSIATGQEFLLTALDGTPVGLSVAVSQVVDPGANLYNIHQVSATEDELLLSDLSFSNSNQKWLSAIPDIDGAGDYDWIASGATSTPNSDDNDANVAVPGSNLVQYDDPSSIYEGCVGGMWAPYRLCRAVTPKYGASTIVSYKYAPALGFPNAPTKQIWKRTINNEIDDRNLASVDIVFTSDKSKWTRCVVLEMGYDKTKNIGGQSKFLPRLSPSVDRNGNIDTVNITNTSDINSPNYVSPTGMGWFPGYAINVETGERLNIAFGENSSDSLNHGQDMIWNPTSDIPGFAGMHYVYVFGHNSDGVDSQGKPIDVPKYDAGAKIFQMLNTTIKATALNNYNDTVSVSPTFRIGYGQQGIVEALRDIMWVSPALISSEYSGYFPDKHQPSIPTTAKVRIRVKKPLRYGLAGNWASAYSKPEKLLSSTSGSVDPGTHYLDDTIASHLTDYLVTSPTNNNFPKYAFNTYGLAPSTNVTDVAKSALDLINVVPNPYYGHSQYEKTRIDNYIKFVNLPNKCTIRIYTLNGTLLRTIKKNTDATTDVYWDLKNDKNILVTSGLYVVHVDAGDLGEKILKWFCVMRPIDLQSY